MPITITQGEERTFKLKLRDADTQDPINLTGATISVYLPNGSSATSATVSGSALLGTIDVVLSETESATLPAGTGSIEVEYVIATVTRIVQFKNAITVLAQIF